MSLFSNRSANDRGDPLGLGVPLHSGRGKLYQRPAPQIIARREAPVQILVGLHRLCAGEQRRLRLR